MDLKIITRTYIEKIRPLAQRELAWFQSQPNLRLAIRNAGFAINDEGKRYSHQRKIKKGILPKAEKKLADNLTAIRQCLNFDELFYLIDSLLKSIDRIGELYVYDTSLRIGAKLNKLPKKVYLHAGTREGAKALGFDGKTSFIELADLPVEFQELEPYEVEDVLCIFKDKLKHVKLDLSDEEMRRRSRCS